MIHTLYDLIRKAEAEDKSLDRYARANGLELREEQPATVVSEEALLSRYNYVREYIWALLTGTDSDGKRYRVPTIDIQQALSSSDAPILFPRIISEILLEPTEPVNWLTENATEIVTVENAPLLVEFPALSALQAYELAEGQEYVAQALSFQEHLVSVRLRKLGVMASINEEVIKGSQWPILRLTLKALANAIARKQESLLYQAMMNRGMVVFDNESTDSSFHTTGKASDQSKNYSFSYDDLITLVGAIIAKRYEPTHFLAHPMAWPIFATDPLLRAQFLHGGQIATSIWKTAPRFDQSLNFPFGIQYIPYYAMPFKENATLSGPGSGLPAANITTVTLIDARNCLFAVTRGDTELDEMDNWLRDSRSVKARKYLGVATKDQGRGIAHAKGIRLVKNDQAIFTVRTIST